MAGNRKPAQPYWRVVQWHDRARQSTSFCTSRDSAIRASYQTFVSGAGFPEAIVTPDEVTIGVGEDNGENDEAGGHESLPALWDQWLQQHPEERAAWDTGLRAPRLQMLEQQHAPDPRPFTSESIVANPTWYRRLYGILGMTDEMFETFVDIHRVAVAEKEAQRLVKEQGQRGAPRRKRKAAAIYLEGYPIVPDHSVVPLETQARACRAYCKRMGYMVHRVYRASAPPQNDVPFRRAIGIVPGEAFVYYRRESDHPYHAARNLLEERTVDVIVEFVASGPSRSFYGDDLPDASSRLPQLELASLWEIEPPTEDERQMHEVITRIGDAETEEERRALAEQVRTLGQRMKADGRAITLATSPTTPDPEVRPEKSKVCYACQLRPARDGSAFCSDACAQAAAEVLVQATTRGWCGKCGTWIGAEGCPHST